MITVYREVEVDIEASALVDDLSPSEKQQMAEALLGDVMPHLGGQGDLPRINTIIERAYIAAKAMPVVPRVIADLFWQVHGRAL